MPTFAWAIGDVVFHFSASPSCADELFYRAVLGLCGISLATPDGSAELSMFSFQEGRWLTLAIPDTVQEWPYIDVKELYNDRVYLFNEYRLHRGFENPCAEIPLEETGECTLFQ